MVCGWLPALTSLNSHPVALHAAQAGSRHPPVVGPGREEDAWGDFDVFIDHADMELAQCLAARQGTDLAVIPFIEHICRVEAIGNVVHLSGDAGSTMAVLRLRLGIVPSVGWLPIGRSCFDTPDDAAGGGNAADCQAAGEDRLEEVATGKLRLCIQLMIHNPDP